MSKNTQTGRSMVEMLAVLSIIGILSIGGVAGFSMANQRIRINNILDYATKFSAKGVGGRSFVNLAAAGMDKTSGIEMRMDDAGNVCLQGFNEPHFFSAFKAQATAYKQNKTSVTIDGTGYKCDIVLKFGKALK